MYQKKLVQRNRIYTFDNGIHRRSMRDNHSKVYKACIKRNWYKETVYTLLDNRIHRRPMRDKHNKVYKSFSKEDFIRLSSTNGLG